METTNRTQDTTRQAANTLLALGIAHIPLLGFHFAFPWLFGWSKELPLLTNDNAGLFLCFHLCGMFWLGSMGAATYVDASRLLRLEPPCMPRGFWLWMAGFYLLRAAVEFPCFGITAGGIAVVVLVLALALLYLRAWALQAPPSHETVPDQRFDI